jgi:phosphoglucosamine mutase
MIRSYFGTDGVRGPYGGPVINEDFAARLGLAAALWAAAPGSRVLIGRDTRASGPSLVGAIAAGLRAGGLDPVDMGVCPTPALARAVRAGGARLGVVITASHNPASDNGIKFFNSGGLKLTDAEEAAIEARLPAPDAVPAWRDTTACPVADGIADYIADLAALLPADSLAGWPVVIDTAHGATTATTPAVLQSLGARITSIGAAPDGTNINASVGSEHPELLARTVLAAGARLGIAHDGDGDRCILCDERGEILDGDEILVILALDALRRQALDQHALVVTVQSNLGVDAALAAAGARVERTDVGDRHVLARLLALGATLGGESSGHIIDLKISPTGDGLAAAIGVLRVMQSSGKHLSELRRALKKFPQATRNLRIVQKRPLEACTHLVAELSKLEGELGAAGRVMARFSGTEAKLRLLAEAADQATVAHALDRLEQAAKQDLDMAL